MMRSMNEDTIYAPSSAVGGAIAVIRISGARARKTAELLDRDILSRPRELTRTRANREGELLDDCMAVWFPAPHSYTGEDMVEINCHGGAQSVQKLLGALAGLGFRPAAGGEFTRRAFFHDKMDLSQAEAVMDVVTADAEQSLKAALLQLEGSISRAVGAVETRLLNALSGIDAAIDYPEEAEAEATEALPEELAAALGDVRLLIQDGRRGRVLRDGLRVLILGRPNVGKSSLMNALLGHERAIVTASAGTTRDVLDERLSVEGVPLRLIDTAGIREADSEAERIGVDRARAQLRLADVVCIVLDQSEALSGEDRALLEETSGMTRIVLYNKCDLRRRMECAEEGLFVSTRTGVGLEALKQEILRLAAPERASAGLITNERHIHALEKAEAALVFAACAGQLELAATDIREALHALGTITGTDVDADIIDRIFSRFCVGK